MIRSSLHLWTALAVLAVAPARAETVAIPFRPQIGSVWAVTAEHGQTRERAGKVVESTAIDTSYRVSIDAKTDDGYRVTWTTLDARARSDNLRKADLAAAIAERSKGVSVVATTTSDGMPVRVENLPALTAWASTTLLNSFAGDPAFTAPEQKQILDRMVAGLAQATPEAAIGLYLQTALILGTAQGTALELGVDRPYEEDIPNLLGGGTLPTRGVYRLDSIDRAGGLASIAWRRTLDPDAAMDVARNFLRQLIGDKVAADKMDAALAGARLERLDEGSFQVSLDDGVVRRADYAVTISIMNEIRREKRVIAVRPAS